MKTNTEIVIEFPGNENCNWTLQIRREGNSPNVEFAMYWGDKQTPTHWGVHPASEIKAAMDRLFQQGEE